MYPWGQTIDTEKCLLGLRSRYRWSNAEERVVMNIKPGDSGTDKCKIRETRQSKLMAGVNECKIQKVLRKTQWLWPLNKRDIIA
jgi:hypothetical protein